MKNKIGVVILHEVPQCTWNCLLFSWPTSENSYKKCICCFQVNPDQNPEKRINLTLRGQKYFFKAFRRLVNKMRVHRGTSCENTATTDKSCGNESTIRNKKQNYTFFQCIFPIFQFWRPKRNGPGNKLKKWICYFGVNILKCNGLSKLLIVYLGPFVMPTMQ